MQERANLATCPACAGHRASIVHVHHADGSYLQRDVMECPDCHLLFAQPALEMDWSNLPADAFMEDWRGLDLSGLAFFFADVMAAVNRHGLLTNRDITRPPHVLEVGCGGGHMLAHFRAHGWVVQGVEPWRELAAAGRKYLGLPIAPQRLEDAAIADASQDLVLSFDVLSLIADPRAHLEICLRALQPGGMLYLTVANAASAERSRQGWDWPYFQPAVQLGAYSPESLRRLAEASGFTNVEITPYSGEQGDLFLHLSATAPGVYDVPVWQAPEAERLVDYTRDDGRAPVCPVCADGHPALAHVHCPGDPDRERRVYRCQECSFMFPFPAAGIAFETSAAEEFHNDWQTLNAGQPRFFFNDIISAALRNGVAVQQEVGEPAPRVLEIGCGGGLNLATFRAHGWDVLGVEPWAAVAAIAAKYLRLPILPVRLEDAEIEPGSQDVLISIDVLSFVRAPLEHLRLCLRALRPGGLLYLSVPNVEGADAVAHGNDWDYFNPEVHLGGFNRESLRRVLLAAGFGTPELTTRGGAQDDLFLNVSVTRPARSDITWADLSGTVEESQLPFLDRAEVDMAALTPLQRQWRENGVVMLPKLLPDDLIDAYCKVREQVKSTGGWRAYPPPHMDVPELLDICTYKPLSDVLEELIGHRMGLSLNLTGWVSTERDWHQDDYLNPPSVTGHYVAVWMAMAKIQPDAGPFQYVPGSHRWPLIRREQMLKLLNHDGSDDSWPSWSEKLLTPFFENELVKRQAKVERFMAERGDVLVWHSRLVHRGSPPIRMGAERRSLIAHYSAVNHRPDMGEVRQNKGGGYYFVFEKGQSPGLANAMAGAAAADAVPPPKRLIGRLFGTR